jgi:hypothetical protein
MTEFKEVRDDKPHSQAPANITHLSDASTPLTGVCCRHFMWGPALDAAVETEIRPRGPRQSKEVHRERMNRYLAALLVVLGGVGLLGVVAVGRGFADDENATGAKCSEATLKGTYLFAQNGVEIKGNDQRPFAIAGYDVFDGSGEVKGLASANFNGKITRKEPLPGTYTVKANCTGTLTFTNGTRYDIFMAPDGSKFTFVHTNPELVSSSFEQRGSAKRVGG